MAVSNDSQRLDLLEEEEFEENSAKQAEETEEIAETLDIPSQDVEQDIIEMPDGGVIFNFQNTKTPFENAEFYDNLAEQLDESVLSKIAFDFLEFIRIDTESRKERDKQYEEGLRRTGLGEPAPGGVPTDEGSKVTHPLLAEAVVDFAASASKELLPPGDLVRTAIKGKKHDKQTLDRSERKYKFLNWQLNEQISNYRDESEELLTQLPLGGSCYKKWFFDHDLKRPNVEWIPTDRLILPFACTSIYTASRTTEIEDISFDTLRLRIDQGIYRDVDALSSEGIDPLNPPLPTTDLEPTQSEVANRKIEGKNMPERDIDGTRRLYHVYAWLRITDDKESKGERAPYYFTIDEDTEMVLGLYRNWECGDENLTKLDWIVEFKFIPWRGAMGIGLPQLIGGLSAASTGALRALLDAAHNSNSQTLAMLKDGVTGETLNIEPNQIVEINSSPMIDDVRKVMMPLPFNPPSPVLFQLLGWLTEIGRGVVSTADEKMQDLPANTAATTVLNLVESGAKVFSSIHARLHRAQARELLILSRINYWYLDKMTNNSGVKIEVKDFASNTDITPVSDPHIFSETQRLQQAQAVLQLAQTAKDPKLYDERKVHKIVMQAMRVPYVDEVLPDPEGIVESNPVLENVKMAMGEMSSPYPDQDHVAHLLTHLAFMQDKNYGANPLIAPACAPLMLQHIKQHLIMHYLQSVRDAVKRDADGEDIFNLHEERAISVMEQQAIAMTVLKVSALNQPVLAEFLPQIEELQKKASEQAKSKQEQAIMADPSAAVLLKTEQAKLQFQTQQAQQDAQFKVQELQQKYQAEMDKLTAKVDELLGKYEADKQLDAQKNATAITIAAMNNDSRERTEELKIGVQASDTQLQLEHERELLAAEAESQARQAITQHGLDVEKQNINNEAQMAQQALQQAQAPQSATPQAPVAPMKGGGLAQQVIAQKLGINDLTKSEDVANLMKKGDNNGNPRS